MESSIIKPFYLKSDIKSMRTIIASGIILVLLGFASLTLLALVPFYLIYLWKVIKTNKGERGLKFEEVLKLYNEEKYKECIEKSRELLSKFPDHEKTLVIRSLCEFNLQNYKVFVEGINNLNSKKLAHDVDIKLKLGESYEKLGNKDKALEIYKELRRIFPKSEFLKKKFIN